MKKNLLVFIAIFLCKLSTAQEISKLTLPASPAFSILDFEPSAVMKPTSVKSLATDVLNSFDKDGKLLMNLGLEVAPYWLGSHPNLKMKNYLNPNFSQTFLQSLSLSGATVKDSASGTSKLGIGFRFKLFNGEPVVNVESKTAIANLKIKTTVSSIIIGSATTGEYVTKKEAIDDIVRALGAKTEIDKVVIEDFISTANKLEYQYIDNAEDVKSFLIKLNEVWVAEYIILQEKVSELLYQRKGFVAEFAGASGYNASKNNSLEKWGIWGNFSYYVSPDDLFTLTIRGLFNNMDTSITNIDAGLSFLKKTDKFNVSAEAVFRHYNAKVPDRNINNQPIVRFEENNTYRLAVQGSYNISSSISLNVSFGKDFDSPIVSKPAFFSIMGINYSIFSKELAKFK